VHIQYYFYIAHMDILPNDSYSNFKYSAPPRVNIYGLRILKNPQAMSEEGSDECRPKRFLRKGIFKRDAIGIRPPAADSG